jgi:hypothetical protein
LYYCLVFGVPALLCYVFVARPLRFGLCVGALALTAAAGNMVTHTPVFQERSFFGVLTVEKGRAPVHRGGELTTFTLRHGSTLHGTQFRDPNPALDAVWRRQPLMYFHRNGPVGRAFAVYNTDPSRPYGVIGLGTGTMATYALSGQHVTFYEIDPVVRAIAFDSARYFTFVSDARQRGAIVDLVMGDARLTLERRQLNDRQKYGLLVVDAFSSDSIPVHLITRQALQLYFDRVRPDGIVLFHVSNSYLDFRPVLANLAKADGLTGYSFIDEADVLSGKTPSVWVALAKAPEHLGRLLTEPSSGKTSAANGAAPTPAHPQAASPWEALVPEPKVGVWTDDYSNLLSVFDWAN